MDAINKEKLQYGFDRRNNSKKGEATENEVL